MFFKDEDPEREKKERGASKLSRPPPTVTGEDQKCVEIEMLGEARIQIAVQKRIEGTERGSESSMFLLRKSLHSVSWQVQIPNYRAGAKSLFQIYKSKLGFGLLISEQK